MKRIPYLFECANYRLVPNTTQDQMGPKSVREATDRPAPQTIIISFQSITTEKVSTGSASVCPPMALVCGVCRAVYLGYDPFCLRSLR